jgi:hypothetical protein
MTTLDSDSTRHAGASASGRACRDLPVGVTNAVPVLIMLAFVVSVVLNLDAAPWWLAQEAGFFEHGTVVVLVPAVFAGVYAFLRGRFPRRWIRWWVLAWAVACLYFAGEECSWGQHYFGWGTPEPIAELNKQNETNLHNMSTWLNMKPRTLVEIWILVGGLIIPAARLFEKPRPMPPRPDPGRAEDWFWPTTPGIAAAGMNIVGRAFDAARHRFDEESPAFETLTQLGSSEAREFFIALFLSVWLIGLGLRVHATRK